MWGVPQDVLNAKDDRQAINYVMGKLTDPDAFVAKMNEIISRPEAQTHDEVKLKDGRVFDRYSAPLHRAAHQLDGRIWYFRDITAEHRLRATQAQLAAIVEASYDAIITTNFAGEALSWNGGATARFCLQRRLSVA